MKLSERISEFIYLLSTDDKYSEFDSRKSFNRVNKPDSESNLLYSHHNQSTSEFIGPEGEVHVNNVDGVHEVRLAWRHIKNCLSKYLPDLLNSLQDSCTDNDLNDFQKDLGIIFPNCLLEFFKTTDGQSNYGYDNQICGLIFGLKLMSLDEIMIETENWRKVSKLLNQEILQRQALMSKEISKVPNSHSSSSQFKKKLSSNVSVSSTTSELLNSKESRSSSISSGVSSTSNNSMHFMRKQKSVPPGMIHETFSHPMWIPIITDGVGNYIGVDLSPPSKGPGSWGQIILFGRDFDTKFRIASTWGDFLLTFAKDLELGNWRIKTTAKNNYGDLMIGNEGDLIYVDKESMIDLPYLEVLKKRCIKEWADSLCEEDKKDHDISALLGELIDPISEIKKFSNLSNIDSYINSNLTNIDNLNTPTKKANAYSSPITDQVKPEKFLNVKSPLSNEISSKEVVPEDKQQILFEMQSNKDIHDNESKGKDGMEDIDI